MDFSGKIPSFEGMTGGFEGMTGGFEGTSFGPNFTPPAEAFGHMEAMATRMFGTDSTQVQGLKDAFSGQRSFESLDTLFGGPPQSFGPPPAWGDAPPPGMDFSGPAPWMPVPDGWGQGMPGKGPEGSVPSFEGMTEHGPAPWMMGPPPSAWGGEGQDSGPPAWMIPSFEGTSFNSFEGSDAPSWMIPSSEGTSFSGSDSSGSEDDLELEQSDTSGVSEQGIASDDAAE